MRSSGRVKRRKLHVTAIRLFPVSFPLSRTTMASALQKKIGILGKSAFPSNVQGRR
jgi:hypothetical protein